MNVQNFFEYLIFCAVGVVSSHCYKEMPQCPEEFASDGAICYILSSKTNFPAQCPFKDTLPFNTYKHIVVAKNLSPVWLPVLKGTNGMFYWVEKSVLYQTAFNENYHIPENFIGNCMLFYNESYKSVASCNEEHSALCAYKKLSESANQLCGQINCFESDFDTKTKCFCLENEPSTLPKAQLVKKYHNSICSLLTNGNCSIGLEKTGNTFLWSRSSSEATYTNWSPDVIFDDTHIYGACTRNGWILTETPLACSIVEREIENLEPSLSLSIENQSTLVLNVVFPNYIKDFSIYCFTDAHPSERFYRYTINTTNSENVSTFQLVPLRYGPGYYWCNLFKYSDSSLIKSNVLLYRGTVLREFVIVIREDEVEKMRQVLHKSLHIQCYYTATILNIVETDKVLVRLLAKTENLLVQEEYKILKNLFKDIPTVISCEPFLRNGTFIGTNTTYFCSFSSCKIMKWSQLSKKLLFLVTNPRLDELPKIWEHCKELVPFDIYLLSCFYQRLNPLEISPEEKDLALILRTLNRILATDEDLLHEAQEMGALDNFLNFTNNLERYVDIIKCRTAIEIVKKIHIILDDLVSNEVDINIQRKSIVFDDDKTPFKYNKIVSYVTTVCCFLSLSGFTIIIITAISSKTWRGKTGNQILVNFISAVKINVILCFFAPQISSKNLSFGSCVFLGSVVHYSILSQFSWMLIIAILQFRRFVLVFASTPQKLVIKSFLFAWSLPLLPVVPIIIFHKECYVNEKIHRCLLHGFHLLLGVWVPILLVVIFNICVFVYIIYSICYRKIDSGKYPVAQQWRLAFLLFFLLGITWLFGFFANFNFGIHFVYLFDITNSLQGFIIFVYFIILNEDTRRMYVRTFKKCLRIPQ